MATWDNIKKLMKMSKEERDVLAQPSIMDEIKTNPEQDELIELAKGQKEAIDNSLTSPTAGIISKSQVPKVISNLKNPTRENLLNAITEGSPTSSGKDMLAVRELMREANAIAGLEELGLTGRKLNEDLVAEALQKRDPKLFKKLKFAIDPNLEKEGLRGVAEFKDKLIKLEKPDVSTGFHELAHFQDIAKDPNFRSRPINLIDKNYKNNPTQQALDLISKGHHITPYFEQDDTVRALRKMLDLKDEMDLFSNPSIKGKVIETTPIAPMDINPLIKKR